MRAGRRAFASGGPYPYVILPCKDGSVCLIGRARQEWDRLVQAMGEPDWTKEPRYQDLQAMGRDYPDEVAGQPAMGADLPRPLGRTSQAGP